MVDPVDRLRVRKRVDLARAKRAGDGGREGRAVESDSALVQRSVVESKPLAPGIDTSERRARHGLWSRDVSEEVRVRIAADILEPATGDRDAGSDVAALGALDDAPARVCASPSDRRRQARVGVEREGRWGEVDRVRAVAGDVHGRSAERH